MAPRATRCQLNLMVILVIWAAEFFLQAVSFSLNRFLSITSVANKLVVAKKVFFPKELDAIMTCSFCHWEKLNLEMLLSFHIQ